MAQATPTHRQRMRKTATTIQKRRELLVGKLLPFCERRGFHRLRELTVEALRAFRQTWTYSPLSAVKRLEYLRAFLRFCYEAAWIDANPALALRPTKVSQKQTLPFTDEEIGRTVGSPEEIEEEVRALFAALG